ncbi:MAG: family 20 glycosylhydrolase [Chitinivibrionales bacterium]|nr:family 20 glycosylhydrolase [Chitinivibrionales bacterium]MBD3396057.1 family 20 glycosylhydrolase [Chitinivibrionales bacterium]
MTTTRGISLVWDPKSTPKDIRKAIGVLGAHYAFRRAPARGMKIVFDTDAPADTCTITVKDRTARIACAHRAMTMRALGALLAGCIPEGSPRTEHLSFDTLGIMLDCSRNAVMTVDHFKGWLRKLCLLGYNMAMLYTEDTYALPGEPFFGYLRGPYTKKELTEIDAYAAKLGIEMIPCIQTLGHMGQILKWPVYQKSIADTGSVMMPRNPQTYELIDKMLAFWSAAFRSRRIHIGMDECEGLGEGAFRTRFGTKRTFDIFNDHCRKVVGMCAKHGYRPMIWSDMYYKMGSRRSVYYDPASKIPADVRRAMPKNMQLVYWDYYHNTPSHYRAMIDAHRKIGYEPLMASGVWTWLRIWYDHATTAANAGACIDACKKTGTRELFFTMWGDDGAYCDFDSAFAGLAFSADRAYAARPGGNDLNKRVENLCGVSCDALCAAGKLNSILDFSGILWDDPLLGIQLHRERANRRSTLIKALTEYRKVKSILMRAGKKYRGGNLSHACLLAEFLSRKVETFLRIADAYRKKDKRALAGAARRIAATRRTLGMLMESYRSMWHERNKPFGLELIQIRLGSQLARYDELASRIGEYRRGSIARIEELDASLPAPPDGDIGAGTWRKRATSTSI